MPNDVREMYDKLKEPKRLAVIEGVGHIHWSDSPEIIHEAIRATYPSPDFADSELDGPAMAAAFRPFSELCPAQHTSDTMRAVCLAHFESHLKQNEVGAEFIENDLAGALIARGVKIEVS